MGLELNKYKNQGIKLKNWLVIKIIKKEAFWACPASLKRKKNYSCAKKIFSHYANLKEKKVIFYIYKKKKPDQIYIRRTILKKKDHIKKKNLR